MYLEVGLGELSPSFVVIDRLSDAESNVAIYYCQGGWKETLKLPQLLELSRKQQQKNHYSLRHNKFLFPENGGTLAPQAVNKIIQNLFNLKMESDQNQNLTVTRGFIIAKPREAFE